MTPLRDVEWFRHALSTLSNPILGVLVGIIFTVIIQSASASVGVLQIMAMSGVIGFNEAFFVMMGMNIGASVAPVIASIGGRKDAKRVACIVALFESFGMVFFLIVSQIFPIVKWISETATNPSRQLANANTIFNCVTVVILFPFTKYLAKLACVIIKGEDKESEHELKYINEAGYQSPSILIEQIDAEVKRMQGLVRENLVGATSTFFSTTTYDRERFDHKEEQIDFLNKAITDALVHMSSLETTEEEAKHTGNLYHVVTDLERIGDHAENMVAYANRMIEDSKCFSGIAKEELRYLIDKVYQIYDDACKHLYEPEQYTYDKIYHIEEQIDGIVDAMKENHIERMNDLVCNSTQGLIFIETLTDLERVSDHALNIAQASKQRYNHTEDAMKIADIG